MCVAKSGGLGKKAQGVGVNGRLEGSVDILDILCPYC